MYLDLKGGLGLLAGLRAPAYVTALQRVRSEAGEHADGTAIGNHLAVELMHKAKGSDAGWVAIHEFTHAMYQLAPSPRKAALNRQFVEAGGVSGQAFYMYLNEVLATTVEIRQAERQEQTLDEPYTDPYIPTRKSEWSPDDPTASQPCKP